MHFEEGNTIETPFRKMQIFAGIHAIPLEIDCNRASVKSVYVSCLVKEE